MEQRTDEWFAARMGKISASRMSDVMMAPTTAGYQRYKAELATEICAGERFTFNAAATNWGKFNEPLAQEEYEFRTNNQIIECGFIDHPTIYGVGASPDGLVGDDGQIEIKCPYDTFRHVLAITDPRYITKEHGAQIQCQLWVTGREWCDFVSFDPRMPVASRFYRKRIAVDPEYREEMIKKVATFRQEVDDLVQVLMTGGLGDD